MLSRIWGFLVDVFAGDLPVDLPGGVYPEKDLTEFEVKACLGLWADGESAHGVEINVERFTENDVEYFGFAKYETLYGIQFLEGYLHAAYLMENVADEARIEAHEAHLEFMAAGVENLNDSRNVA